MLIYVITYYGYAYRTVNTHSSLQRIHSLLQEQICMIDNGRLIQKVTVYVTASIIVIISDYIPYIFFVIHAHIIIRILKALPVNTVRYCSSISNFIYDPF